MTINLLNELYTDIFLETHIIPLFCSAPSESYNGDTILGSFRACLKSHPIRIRSTISEEKAVPHHSKVCVTEPLVLLRHPSGLSFPYTPIFQRLNPILLTCHSCRFPRQSLPFASSVDKGLCRTLSPAHLVVLLERDLCLLVSPGSSKLLGVFSPGDGMGAAKTEATDAASKKNSVTVFMLMGLNLTGFM